MKYIRVDPQYRVLEIIPEYVDEFPNIPINERYSNEFIKELIKVPDNIEVSNDMIYSPEDNKFYLPEDMYNLRSKLNYIESINDSLLSQTTDLQMALCESYENSENQLTDIQMALCEVYELLQGGTT